MELLSLTPFLLVVLASAHAAGEFICPQLNKTDPFLCCSPRQEPGHCVPLEKCASLSRIVAEDHRITPEERQLFINSVCPGGTADKPKVCCPVVSMDYCGPYDPNKISGGWRATPMEYPWMVLLGYPSADGTFDYNCGGSLINNRYVLTAAHCVPTHRKPVIVRLGEHDMNTERDCYVDITNPSAFRCAPPTIDVGVERVIIHDGFDDNTVSDEYLQNDIALIRLNTSVTFSEAVTPICLPLGDLVASARSRFNLAGWGLIREQNRPTALQAVTIPYVPLRQCVERYDKIQARSYRKVPIRGPNQFCAGGEPSKDGEPVKGSCGGDSGGPLTYIGALSSSPLRIRQVQIGIVSFGTTKCSVASLPSVFTTVRAYLLWILRNLQPPEDDYRFQSIM